MRDVFIRGIGLHTSLARNLAGNVAALERPPVPPRTIPVDYAGSRNEVPCYLLADAPLDAIEQRFNSAIDGVIDAALTQSQVDVSVRRALALFIGSSCGDMPILEAQYRRDLQQSSTALAMTQSSSLGNLANAIRTRFGFRGPDFSFYTACTASANLCDTHSISATNPDGSAVELVIHQALSDAALQTNDIVAIKMHGTASLLNDEAESAGVRRVFASLPPLSALKPYLGHTFGACGAAELALFCGSIDVNRLPAAYGIAAESDLNVSLNQTPEMPKQGAFMLNYFGFGGSNTSLIVSNS